MFAKSLSFKESSQFRIIKGYHLKFKIPTAWGLIVIFEFVFYNKVSGEASR